MARNPFYQSRKIDAQSTGVQGDHSSANPVKTYGQGMNSFDNSYRQAATLRFADVHPFLVFDTEGRDVIPYSSKHKLHTYTLASPMLSDLHMHKSIYAVPWKCILPQTWDLFYANPTKGDDVPDDVYPSVDITSALAQFTEDLTDSISSEDFVKFMISCELVFSKGGLLSALKCNIWTYLHKDSSINFDTFFDTRFIPWLKESKIQLAQFIDEDAGTYRIVRIKDVDYIGEQTPSAAQVSYVSIHTFLDILREGDWSNMYFTSDSDPRDVYDTYYNDFYLESPLNSGPVFSIDLSRVIAYQLACINFQSDDAVDYIYTANLFRNMVSHYMSADGSSFPYGTTFTYNQYSGIYDVFSGKLLNSWLIKSVDSLYNFCSILLSYRKSLKFGDYFVSSRPNVLAVGDINAPVIGNNVNAIDMTESIIKARFLNMVNRVGQRIGDYVKALSGVDLPQDYTDPLFIAHESFPIGGFEVENTGDAQTQPGTNSVTTLLRSTQSQYLFEINMDMPCILIGVAHFDIKRLYTRIVDRSFFRKTRFDFFNKMFQYVGDQEIYSREFNATASENTNFSYTTRNMEFKQQISHACGGFIDALKSWAFTAQTDSDEVAIYDNLVPDFIRNANGDFDRFYGSVSGFSLGNYFHFVCMFDNNLPTRRAMDIAPSIL